VHPIRGRTLDHRPQPEFLWPAQEDLPRSRTTDARGFGASSYGWQL
jgi:hypothetical protein